MKSLRHEQVCFKYLLAVLSKLQWNPISQNKITDSYNFSVPLLFFKIQLWEWLKRFFTLQVRGQPLVKEKLSPPPILPRVIYPTLYLQIIRPLTRKFRTFCGNRIGAQQIHCPKKILKNTWIRWLAPGKIITYVLIIHHI